MKRNRLISLLLVIMIIGLSLAGCTTPAQDSPEAPLPEAESPEVQAPEASGDSPITVTDQGGNVVTLDQPASRLVTGFYGQTYAMIALGLEDRLVAMDRVHRGTARVHHDRQSTARARTHGPQIRPGRTGRRAVRAASVLRRAWHVRGDSARGPARASTARCRLR